MARTLSERPAAFVSHRIDDRHADRVFEPEQRPNNDDARSPWTGKRNVQMIPPRFGRIFRPAVSADPVIEEIPLTDELTVQRLLVRELGFDHQMWQVGAIPRFS